MKRKPDWRERLHRVAEMSNQSNRGGKTVITDGKTLKKRQFLVITPAATRLQPCRESLFHFHWNGLFISACLCVSSGCSRRKRMFTKLIHIHAASALQEDTPGLRPLCSKANTWDSRLEIRRRVLHLSLVSWFKGLGFQNKPNFGLLLDPWTTVFGLMEPAQWSSGCTLLELRCEQVTSDV